MSFRLFIYYCALCGGWAAFFGWALGRMMSPGSDSPIWQAAFRGMWVGLAVALGLSLVDSLWSASGRNLAIVLGRVFVAVTVGCLGGLIGGIIGQLFFDWTRLSISLVFGWTITGLLIGVSLGVFDQLASMMRAEDLRGANRKIFNGLLGGSLGGALGGIIGGGSNAIGAFYEFIKDKKVRLVGVEAGGRGEALGDHAARFRGGLPGVLQGTFSYVLQDTSGQIATTHSISAGLDYSSIGPEHAALADSKRAEYVAASDKEALDACVLLARTEGIIPALESAHAVAECVKRAPRMKKSEVLVVNISGRGDKDIGILRETLRIG